jgi:RNase adaptor protein for sRNA GlmZ degradation
VNRSFKTAISSNSVVSIVYMQAEVETLSTRTFIKRRKHPKKIGFYREMTSIKRRAVISDITNNDAELEYLILRNILLVNIYWPNPSGRAV